jgi:hypothetical protein
MPSKSQAQNRFMHEAAEGKVPGVKPSVGKEFVAADKGRKVGKLPEFVAKKTSKPGAVKRAREEDTKQDHKVAKKHGVTFTGH